MKDSFPDTQANTLQEDSLGLFTRFSFLPVHFDWTTTDIDESAIQEYGLNPLSKGAVVSFVEEGSAGELAGILEGDVIIELNKHPIQSVSEYSLWYQRLKKEKAVLVVLIRASRHLYVLVKSS